MNRNRLSIFLFCLFLWSLSSVLSHAQDGKDNFFEFEQVADLPVKTQGAYAGRVADGLLVIGGSKKTSAYFLGDGANQWQRIGDIPVAIKNGASATDGTWLYCVGGQADGKPSQRVDRFAWDGGSLQHESLKSLPMLLAEPTATFYDGRLFVAGQHQGGNVFLAIDPNVPEAPWENQLAWEKAPCVDLAMASLNLNLYLFARDAAQPSAPLKAWSYNATDGWKGLGDTTFNLAQPRVVPCGDAHLLLLNDSGKNIYGFYSVTSNGAKLGELPKSVRPWAMTYQDKSFTVFSEQSPVHVTAVFPPTKYGYFDHGIVAIFFLAMLFIGKYMAKRERSENDYFRGGQRVPWWAAGLSMFATGASAISLMAMPGKAFAENWIYFTGALVQLMVLPFTLFYIVPLARRLRSRTAFEYLERRFSAPIRIFGSVIFSMNQMLARMAAIMLLPAIALSAICGIPMSVSILIMGVITTIYATMGGLEAVIWTDVIQALIMVLAMILCVVWVVMGVDTSVSEAWTILQVNDKLQMADWSFDIARPIFYIIFLQSILIPIISIGDQNFVQRVQCTKDEKTARKAVATQLFVAVPLNVCLFGLGTCLFLFYHQHPEMLTPAMKADGVFPLFAAQVLPTGLAGLVVAAIMAATMSTLSSAVNSVANLGVEDFLRPLRPNITDHKCLIAGKVFTAALGTFGTVAALLLANTSLTSIWDLAMMLAGMIHAPLMGIFVLGILTRRANNVGVLAGILFALAVTVCARIFVQPHPFFYMPVSVFSCVAVGYLVSCLFPGIKRNLLGLTVYDLPEAE